ncbi:hypothetical protein M413DRAFT_449209 [Hebeloma cylindrosporum]|uniref:DUF1917-domain-containing protein n=1 Tax=Hebeloma cylindrosporum TaxID=76867 RepID=A0A0C2XEI3_HEBCY|nr:hypothetical protein M413DRAFT_449209 [Hebeloma cylindrosporum h7]
MGSMDIDSEMVDVEKTSAPTPAVATPKPNFVSPPSSPDDLLSCWTTENSTQKRLIQALARWPPSRTPFTYGPWIMVDRGSRVDLSTQNLEGLASDFRNLISTSKVSPESLDEISKANNVMTGKWMVFTESSKVDMLWGKIVYLVCMERQKGFVKVSTYQEGEGHVICVYVDDYTNKEEVKELRRALRSLGVKWRIGFKTDAYTHLNIYKENAWDLRPSRYLE